MKKIVLFLILTGFITSCGPKRMRCYGRRCVDQQTQKEITLKTSKEV